jgi:hypothetical protein
MQIDILHVPGCPNLSAARSRVAQALDAVGLAASVREVEITTTEEAEQAGMHGSPTVLVDGLDHFEWAEASLACRLYRSGETVEGAPPIDALVKVFSR